MHQSDLFEPGAAYPADAEVTDRFARLAPTDLNDGEQDSVIQLALRVLEPKVSYDAFTDPETSLRYFRLRFAREPREIFICAFLDVRHRLIKVVELFQGTLDSCNVHPRVVAQTALMLNAAACLLVHNHPSGNPSPSRADVAITERIKDVLSLFDVRVLDHLIVGREGAVSLAREGKL
jgi:DNA repair protein RadC